MDILPGNGEISVYGSEWFVASIGIQGSSRKLARKRYPGQQ